MNRHAFFAAAALATLSACGPSTPPASPDPAKEASTAEPAASAAPTAAPTAAPEAKPAPAESASPAETLARDLVKAGGRRIGWSASKKRFVVPMDVRNDSGRGLDLRFFDDEGAQREILRVCQPGECEERLDELAKELIPKLVARFEKEGFEAVYSVGWPSGRDELEIGAQNLKLRYEKGRLLLVNEKKTTPLRALGGRAPKSESLSAVYPVPAAKLLGVFAGEFYVYKLP